MKMPNIPACRECGSTSLTWDTHNKNISQAQHGRLTTQDVRCQFVLGCDHCSETLAIVSADQVAAWLTEARPAGTESSAPQQPAVKISALALREGMENLAVRASAADMPPVFLPAPVRQVPLVMLGGVCVRVSYSDLKLYHDQLIDDRWEPVTVDKFEALLAEGVAKA